MLGFNYEEFNFFFLILFTFSCTEKPIVEPETKSTLTLISPNGGEVFYSHDLNLPIEWYQKNVKNIDVLYSIDYLENWIILADSINTSFETYLCRVPNVIADSVRLRIRDTQNENVYDDSDKFFSIKEDDPYGLSKVKILTPTTGEVLTGTDKYFVTWSNGELMDKVDLHYSLDNGSNWIEIAANKIISSKMYEWKVPNENTDFAKIRLTAHVANESREIESDGVFKILERQRDVNALAYFPLNIGDIWIYDRDETADFHSETNRYILKKVLTSETVINNIKYHEFETESINKQTSEVSSYSSFFRIDTLNKNVYQYFTNIEKLLFNLELFPNEVYNIGSEHYVTLILQDTLQIFGEMINRKLFRRGDIYGYSGQEYELLEKIGIFMESYSADYGYSVKNLLKGAVIDGVVYGDTTFVINQ